VKNVHASGWVAKDWCMLKGTWVMIENKPQGVDVCDGNATNTIDDNVVFVACCRENGEGLEWAMQKKVLLWS
jgi:hypothetical protein